MTTEQYENKIKQLELKLAEKDFVIAEFKTKYSCGLYECKTTLDVALSKLQRTITDLSVK
jgi:uncharacterized coiled-coil protein SlyX